MAPEGKRRWQADSNGAAGDAPDHKKMARRTGPPPTAAAPTVRNAYTAMFEGFRDHLDAHHDRRERIVKASRDITALSKKIIFALQRVRRIHPELPRDVDSEVTRRLGEIGRLLAGIAPEMQGINRGRYGRVLFGMEELLEALTFLHYLRHQVLLSPDEAAEQVAALCVEGRATKDTKDTKDTGDTGDGESQNDEDAPRIVPDDNDFLMGVFDLSGEMMRFATTSAALRGELASDGGDGADQSGQGRTIVGDMQELDSFFRMLPQRHDKSWKIKTQTLQTSVQKVERLGYDLRVRGSERPKGWMPDVPEAGEAGTP
ncbi:hypothetical protein HMPREF1624_03892 [Sporothrix schenckii ATCC 58251]|uniref:Translin n=1 Tax=Sporothrix schenckii (strain ATCC 58251 / de Perez 2211183) TaxID=1391915 RepID=U7PY01_SPOS1|nr:hypothetical protein HMPREF1624_03892 [Sporothrix schenckii ATCC 58251]